MKMVTVIVRPEKFGDVITALHQAGVTGLTVTDVRGQGRQKGATHIYRGTEFRVDFVPKVKIEAAVPNELVEQAIDAAVAAARTGVVGDGKIFVYDLAEVVRVRTGDRGDAALVR